MFYTVNYCQELFPSYAVISFLFCKGPTVVTNDSFITILDLGKNRPQSLHTCDSIQDVVKAGDGVGKMGLNVCRPFNWLKDFWQSSSPRKGWSTIISTKTSELAHLLYIFGLGPVSDTLCYFERLVATPDLETIWPRRATSDWKKWHFFGAILRPTSLMRVNTWLSCCAWSSKFWKKQSHHPNMRGNFAISNRPG